MKKTQYTSYDQLPLMLTVPDVSQVLGISLAGTYELVRSDGFPALKIGSMIVVPKEKFIAWINAQTLGSNCLKCCPLCNVLRSVPCFSL